MKYHYLEVFQTRSETFLLNSSKESIQALVNSKEKTLSFLKPFIPKEGMILTNIETDDSYHLVGNSSKIIVDIDNGDYVGYKIKFLSRQEYESKNKSLSTFNIHSINGPAIVGNQHNATINAGATLEEIKTIISSKSTEDREVLEKLITRIEIILEDNQPISKGTFAKFSDTLNKYSDVAIPLGNILIKWLTTP